MVTHKIEYVGWSLVLREGHPCRTGRRIEARQSVTPLVLQVGGLDWGLITHSRKNKTITETGDIQISINIGEATRVHSSRMTHLGQSRKETQMPTGSIVNPTLETRIGNWNVRTMFETVKASQVAREMERYKLDILGISERKWRGSGKSKLSTWLGPCDKWTESGQF